MRVNVPQFIDIEDKIAFGLTGKQLLWLGGAGTILVILYNLLDRSAFFVAAVFVIVIFGAFAFWRPYGVSFIVFLSFALQFLLRPRNYFWRRDYSPGKLDIRKSSLARKKKSPPSAKVKKLPSACQLRRMAWILDTGGKRPPINNGRQTIINDHQLQ